MTNSKIRAEKKIKEKKIPKSIKLVMYSARHFAPGVSNLILVSTPYTEIKMFKLYLI